MSISDISGMSKALSDSVGIGSTLREFDDLTSGITSAISSITRTVNPVFTDDEVKDRPSIWQQMVCTP